MNDNIVSDVLRCLICEEPIPQEIEEYKKWSPEHKKRCDIKDPELKILVLQAITHMDIEDNQPCMLCGYRDCRGIC